MKKKKKNKNPEEIKTYTEAYRCHKITTDVIFFQNNIWTYWHVSKEI